MGSIRSFSVYVQTEAHHPKFLNHQKSPFFSSNLNPKPQTLSLQPTRKQFPFSFITILSEKIIRTKPISVFPNSNSSILPHGRIFGSFKEKVAVLIFGSFIFIGCFSLNAKPSIALPGNKKSAGENLRQKRETQMGKSDEEEMFENILEKEPRNVEALKVVLHGKMRRGKTKEAVNYVERLIEIEPKEVEWRLLQALCYELMGNFSTAKRFFKEILKERPLLLRALHGLALAMHKNHEGPAVFEMLTEALEVARHENRVTEERNIRILIAQMHVVQGNLEQALEKFQDLVNENPRDFRPYLCQGIVYSLMDKKKEAAEQFELYRSLVPEEFPQRGFIDDVVLAAKTKSRQHLQKEFDSEFSYKK